MKNKNFTSFDFAFTAVIIVLCTFAYIVLVSEVNKKITMVERTKEVVELKKNIIQQKLVEIQKLIAEDRIVDLASNSLGLVRSKSPYKVMRVNGQEIKKIERILEDMYGME